MARRLLVLALLGSLVMMAGCVMPYRATISAPVIKTQSALMLGDTSVSCDKYGEAECEGIVVVAFGDASIKAAMDNGGIKRIHHVDTEEISVLGVYVRQVVRVWGE